MLVFPLGRPAVDLVIYTTAVCYGIVALSLNVLLGYVGQISLGQQAFVGVGAFVSAYMVTVQGQSFWVGVLAAAAIGGGQALVLGGVSLRIRGLYFALVTLAYGLVAEQNIFQIQELTGGGAGQPAPKPAGFDSEWRYYYLCLAFLGRGPARRLADDAHQGRAGRCWRSGRTRGSPRRSASTCGWPRCSPSSCPACSPGSPEP